MLVQKDNEVGDDERECRAESASASLSAGSSGQQEEPSQARPHLRQRQQKPVSDPQPLRPNWKRLCHQWLPNPHHRTSSCLVNKPVLPFVTFPLFPSPPVPCLVLRRGLARTSD